MTEDEIETFSNYGSKYEMIKPFVGYNLIMPIKEPLTLGGELDMYTYKKLSDFFSDKLSIKLLSSNSIDIMNKLDKKELDLALVSEDIFLDAYYGLNNFNKPLKNLRFISGFCYELYYFIFPENSKFNNLQDIISSDNKVKIGTTSKNSISDIVFKKIKSIYKLDKIEYKNYETNELFNLFYRNKLDAIFFVTGIYDPYIVNILNLKSVKFLKLDKTALITSFFRKIIPKNININNYELNTLNSKENIENKRKYTGLTETYGNRIILVTNKFVDINKIYDKSKFIYDNHLIMRNILSSLNNSSIRSTKFKSNAYYNDFIPITMAYVDKDISIHPGAEKYYRDIGFITNNSSYECKEFVGISSCDQEDIKSNKKKYYWKHKKIGLIDFEL